MQTPEQILKQIFGYDAFRPGQRELIGAVLSGRDALGIMPTGAGKSVCYQVPALLLAGITVVVSPLISLMTDQVAALTDAGVPAACLHSGLSAEALSNTLRALRAGDCRLLYVAPERLEGNLTDTLCQLDIAMVTIDEAHCVSQWGQDFRPSYLRIAHFIQALPTRPIVSAFTATATREVRDDIERMLALRRPQITTTGFDRPNLTFAVRHPQDKGAETLRILRERKGKCAIIYCATRKNVERVCEMLQGRDYSATRYHAGLSPSERQANQEDFLYDRVAIMVATNAFGMGIDKSNVGLVIHYNMPKNLESYYQEAGRAGRDGAPADCILLYSGQDVNTNKFLIDNSRPDESLDAKACAAIRQKDLDRLREVTFYCACETCLREYILRYFGEIAPNFCGNCGNCNANFDTVDVTIEAQKIVSCVYRLAQRGRTFGKQMIIDLLRGADNEKIRSWGLSDLSTYGIMAEEKPTRIRAMMEYLLLHGYLQATDGEHPCVALSEKSNEIIKQRCPIAMKLPRVTKPSSAGKSAHGSSTDGGEESLFAALRDLRAQLARLAGVPPYVVFSNKTLQDMAEKQPHTLDELMDVSGVGETKAKRYGAQFLKCIADYLRDHA